MFPSSFHPMEKGGEGGKAGRNGGGGGHHCLSWFPSWMDHAEEEAASSSNCPPFLLHAPSRSLTHTPTLGDRDVQDPPTHGLVPVHCPRPGSRTGSPGWAPGGRVSSSREWIGSLREPLPDDLYVAWVSGNPSRDNWTAGTEIQSVLQTLPVPGRIQTREASLRRRCPGSTCPLHPRKSGTSASSSVTGVGECAIHPWLVAGEGCGSKSGPGGLVHSGSERGQPALPPTPLFHTVFFAFPASSFLDLVPPLCSNPQHCTERSWRHRLASWPGVWRGFALSTPGDRPRRRWSSSVTAWVGSWVGWPRSISPVIQKPTQTQRQ